MRHAAAARLFWFCSTLVLPGCGGISATESAALRRAIEPVPSVFDSTLAEMAHATEDAEIGRILNEPQKTTLGDSDFALPLDPATRSALVSQLDVLQRYAETIQTLADRQYRGQFSKAIGDLNAQLLRSVQTLDGLQASANAPFFPAQVVQPVEQGLKGLSGIASLIGEVGIYAYAQRKALSIVRKANPVIRDYCAAVQVLIHPSSNPWQRSGRFGLVELARNNLAAERIWVSKSYEAVMASRPAQAGASQADWDARRVEILRTYVGELGREQAVVERLAGVRSAIGAFADAHEALAESEQRSFWSAIAAATDFLNLAAQSLNQSQGLR